MADVAVRAVGTPVTDQAASITLGIPAATQTGDLMVAFILPDTSPITVGKPADWSTINDNDGAVNIFYKFHDGSETNPAFTATGRQLCGNIISFYNVDTTTLLDVAENDATYSAPASPYDVTVTGFDTVTAGALAIFVWAGFDDSTWAYRSGGHTQAFQVNCISGNDRGLAVGYLSKATAGGTGDQVEYQSTKGGDAGYVHWFAIKPVADTGINIGTGGTFAQAGKVTEVLAAAVAAQVAREASAAQAAKVTEVLGTLVLPPDIAITSPVQTAKVTEVIAASASTAVVLAADKTDTVKITEVLAGAVEAQTARGVSATQTAKLTEVLAAEVLAQTTLEVSKTEAVKATEALGTEVGAAPALDPLLVQVAQAAHFTEWFSPDFKEVIGISESLQGAVEALAADLDVSTPVQTAKVTEEITAVVVAQTALEASATQTGKTTEVLAASIGNQVDLNAGATQAAKVTEVLGGSVTAQSTLAVDKTETVKATENLTSAITAQPALGVSSTDNAKVTEALTGAVSAAVTLTVDKTESAKVTEVLAGAISAPVTLTADKTDTAKVTEALGAAVVAPVTLETSIADTARVTEVRTVEVEGMASSLEVIVAEVVKTTEATVTEVIAQIAVELAAVDSVAVVTTDLAVSIEAAVSVAGRRFMRIPGKGCINLGSGISSIPGDSPVDTPHIINN